MSTYQTDYSTKPAVALPGQVASTEEDNRISRTVESSAGLAFGQPAFRGTGDNGCVVGATFTGTAAAVADAGNTGNGVMGTVTVSAGAKAGAYRLVVDGTASNAGHFIVIDPDGVEVGQGNVATLFTGEGISFTLADGATDYAVGDGFTITVTFTADIQFLGLAILDPAVPANASTPDAYPQYFTAALMTMGVIWVTAGGTVTQGEDVFWDPSTKKYSNTSTLVRIPGAVFDSGGASNDMVQVAMRLRSK